MSINTTKCDHDCYKKKEYSESKLCSYVKKKNNEIINYNYNLLIETSNIFFKMSDVVEEYKMNLLNLIEDVKRKEKITEGILKKLDNYGELLLITLQKLLDTPKSQNSGLGTKIIPSVPNLYEDDNDSNISFNKPLNYQLSSVLYGSLPNLSCNSINSVGVGSIGVDSSICVSVSLENKEIYIRYKFKNDGTQDLCFPVLWSELINICQSSIITNETNDSEICYKDFIERLLREIKTFSALSSIFSTEYERLKDNSVRYKEQVNKLVAKF